MSERERRLANLSPAERAELFARLQRERARGGSGAGSGGAGRIPRRPGDRGRAPLSFAQQRLWFLDQLEPGNPVYNIPEALRLDGPLDLGALAATLAALVARHETLRTRYVVPARPAAGLPPGQEAAAAAGPRSRAPEQVIDPPCRPLLAVVDLSAVGVGPLPGLLAREAAAPFDLAQGPVLRARLLRLGAASHVVALTVHHIASDGWSRGILIGELAAGYREASGGAAAALPALPVSYGDFAAWQRGWLCGAELDRQLAFWRQALAGAPDALELPTDRPRPAVISFRGARRDRRLATGTAAVQALAREARTTPFGVLLAAWAAFLGRLAASVDLVLGAPIAGRNRPELLGLVGFFVNALPLRVDLGGSPSLGSLVARLREPVLAAFEHQDLPFERLVEELAPPRQAGRTPVFQVAFALQNHPEPALALGEVAVTPLEPPLPTAKFDLTLVVAEKGDRLEASCEHSTDLFEATTIERWLAAFDRLLSGALAAPARPLASLPLLSAAERHQLLAEWSAHEPSPRPEPGTSGGLLAQLRRAVERAPDSLAVVGEGQPDGAAGHWSYGFLLASAGTLAGQLAALGVGPEVAVGILTGRGAEGIVASLAVLLAGGAFLPLDPAHPPARQAQQLAVAPVLLARRGGPPVPPGYLGERLEVDAAWPAVPPSSPRTQATAPAPHPEQLAYVIFTSGSTGEPKAVGVPHRGLDNLVSWHRHAYGVKPADRASVLAGPAFDAAVWEVWPALAAGASVHLAPEEARLSARSLLAWLAVARIDLAFVPTPLAELALAELERPGGRRRELALRWLLTGGDRLRRAPASDLGFAFVNHYGPTEASVVTTAGLVPPQPAGAAGEARAPGLGRPISGLRALVAEPLTLLEPAWAEGELLIGGVGVARGYLGQPGLTAARFVPDPFSPFPGGRLYRSGDLVRRRRDGELEFVGRRDQQVKVRGVRLELGEVEAALAACPGVAAAVALVLPAGLAGAEASLAAAWVAAPEAGDTSEASLRGALREQLPAALVPALLVQLPALPLTANGKLDRAAVQRSLEARPRDDAAVPPPRRRAAAAGRLEGRIAALWAELLGRSEVDREANFFDLGGHSLLLAEMRDRLQDELGGEVPLWELFRHPTVASLAAWLGGEAEGATAAVAATTATAPAVSGDVAIIGIACRLPGADGGDELWQLLAGGVEAIRPLDDQALRGAGVPAELLADPRYVKAAAQLAEPEACDAELFGLSAREAELLDPQHRLFLEGAWQALEVAGYDPKRFAGRIGVYGGASLNDHLLRVAGNREAAAAAGGMVAKIALDKDFLTTRVSYKLGLAGPSVAVQTACSTSLVAVHLACRAVLAGECELALAGGVSLRNLRGEGYLYEEGGVLSPDGHCRTFDAAAAGTVSGDGLGIVVLRPLAAALAAGDAVVAVIKGTAINNDGAAKVGYTAPSVAGQVQVLRDALAAAGVDAATVGYVEAHGTGTPLGDPIEVAALNAVFPARDGGAHRALGSLKPNLGHLDAAAGVAGLIKAALVVQRGEVPPSLHFQAAGPESGLAASSFRVARELAPFPELTPAGEPRWPRRAGVSSFGIGGTNAHAVLEEPPARPASGPSAPLQPLLLSARTPAALRTACARLADHLERHPDLPLADVAFTLACGRRQLEHRAAVVAESVAAATAALRGAAAGLELGRAAGPRAVAFLFPGQGAQQPGLGAAAFASEPVFRRELERAAAFLAPRLGVDPLRLLFPAAGGEEAAAAALRDTALTQPLLFAFEHALARQWQAWGVVPAALLGHSVGEYVAATLAGVWELETALALLVERGKLLAALPPGAMLAVPLAEAELAALLPAGVAIAAVNGPASTVASGPPEAVAQLAATLAARGLDPRPLATSHAFHSALMEPALAAFRDRLATTSLQSPQLPYVANLTGAWVKPEEAIDPDFWVRHLRQPVRFADCLATLAAGEGGRPVLLEVGPGRTLAGFARRHPAWAGELGIVGSLEHAESTPRLALARLWLAGVEVDWPALWEGEARRRLPLPTYPFERRTYALPWPEAAAVAAAASHESYERRSDPAAWLSLPSFRRALAPRPTAVPGGPWLVFADAGGLAAAVLTALEVEPAAVTVVRPGPELAERAAGQWELPPGELDAYPRLWQALAAAGQEPRSVLHLWSLDGTDAMPAVALDLGFFSLLGLARALAAVRGETQLAAVTAGATEVGAAGVTRPLAATVAGPALVLPRELPGVRSRWIDLDPGERPRSGPALAAIARRLAREVRAGEAPPQVAYRGGQRWLPSFEAAELPAAPGRPAVLRPGGTYLLTGGLAGIGRELARFLAREAGAHLVLLGRGGLGDGAIAVERRAAVAELEALGAEVLVVTADVADADALAAGLAAARQRFGPLHGVVHAAGVPGGAALERLARDEATAVLAPKVAGTLLLDALLAEAGEELDFFVLCSSLNAFLPVFGQAAYVAANAFEEAFASWRAGARPGLTLAIAWDRWAETGMAVRAAGESAPRHPWLARRLAAGAAAAFLARFDPERDWVLAEHRLAGTAILPGTAILELVRAAWVEETGEGPLEIAECTFLAPLAVPAGTLAEVYVVLHRAAAGARFEVASRVADAAGRGLWQRHAVGTVGPLPEGELSAAGPAGWPGPVLELAAWQEAAGGSAEGIAFGPRWRSLEALGAAGLDSLARLALPEEHGADLPALGLHPALLDVAAGFGLATLDPAVAAGRVPLAWRGVRVLRPLPARFTSHARLAAAATPGSDLHYALVLRDEAGAVCVEVANYTLRYLGEAARELAGSADRLVDSPADSLAESPADRRAGYQPVPELERLVQAAAEASYGLTNAEGVEVFRRLLAAEVAPRAAISLTDLPSRLQAALARGVDDLLAEADHRGGSLQRHPRPELPTPFVAPRDGAETALAAVWEELLGVEPVGVHDDFFALGGDSILSLRIVARARERGLDLATNQLFEHSTVARLAAALGASAPAAASPWGAAPAAEGPDAGLDAGLETGFDEEISAEDLATLELQLGGGR